MSVPKISVRKACEICGVGYFGPRWYMLGRRYCGRSCQVKALWRDGKAKGPQVGHQVLQKTREKIAESLKGDGHWYWKEEPTYGIVHYWMRTRFGKAKFCENRECSSVSKCFEWAKIRGKTYDRSRENFIQLCRSCHTKYDSTIDFRIVALDKTCGISSGNG